MVAAGGMKYGGCTGASGVAVVGGIGRCASVRLSKVAESRQVAQTRASSSIPVACCSIKSADALWLGPERDHASETKMT